MICPLHDHSMYSSLDGFSTPDEIVQRCLEIGAHACGLTDHGVITGHIPFGQAMTKAGLKPIFGCELYHGLEPGVKGHLDQAHLIGLAMTNQGLANLWSLIHTTSDAIHFHNVGRVFWDDIEKFHEGIVFTSACALGLVPTSILKGDYSYLNRYLNICRDNFYIEIHTYPANKPFADPDIEGEFNMRVINEALVAVAQERGLPMVYANDSHYAFPSQFQYHDLYLAAQTRKTIDTPPEERMWHPPEALAILDEPAIRKSLNYLPESVVDECLANSVTLAERADVTLPQFKRHLPTFIPGDCPWLNDEQKKLSPEDLFVGLVEQGVIDKYGEKPAQEVWDRALYEVEVLLRDGIHHYFLMGYDEMQAALDMGIETGPGRGSSAGSLVAYVLGITDVDPLHYGLIFERFWNSGRAKGFPDIDSDFSRARREKIIAYLEKRWGSDRVCAIGTTGYMKPKAVIDKLRKACNIEFKEAEDLKKIVGKTTKIEILGHKQIGWNPDLEPGKVYYVKNDVGTEIDTWINERADRRELRDRYVKMCEVCCSRVEQYGIHASGIVISDEPLPPLAPAYRRGGKTGKPATMFAMDDIDKLGLVKLDVLGLRTLDVLEFWRQMVTEQGINIVWSGLDKQEHPYEMWKMLHDEYTAGIFQVEDGYGRHLCKSIKPCSVEDLSVINALNRPGPIQAGIPQEYIDRRVGNKPVEYLHPRLEEILGGILDPTYGLFVYQEQIIAFFNSLGYNLSESDAMRKIMGKKQPQDLNAIRDGEGEWKGRGYFDMTERIGIPRGIAEQVWKELEGFADYCLTGDTVVIRASAGPHNKQEITIKELADAWASDTSVGKKLRHRGVNILAYDNDGRIRPARAAQVYSTGIKSVFKITTSDGKSIKATGNHKFLLNTGYCRCDELRVGHYLVTMGKKEPVYIKKGQQTDRAKGKRYNGQGMPHNNANPAWIDGRTVLFINAKRKVSIRAKGRCELCGIKNTSKGHALEFAHTKSIECFSGEYFRYHSPENIRLLCNSCHKRFDYTKDERKKRWTKGYPSELDRIIAIEEVGEEEVFDISMDSSEHNFIANHIVVHNCFNKSHTVAYAIIGFRTLFAKYYGPAYFYAACLRSLEHSSDGEKRKAMLPQFINECRRLDIEVRGPNIYKSRAYTHVDDDGALRFGFYDVKGVANSGPYIEELIHSDYLNPTSPEKFLSSFEAYNERFLEEKKAKVASGEWLPADHRSPKQMLQANKIEALERIGAWGLDANLTRQQEAEQELLGVIVTDNSKEVMERNAQEIAMCDSWDEAAIPFLEKGTDEPIVYTVCGIVTGIEKKTARKSGQEFGIVTIEYGPHAIQFGAYSSKWKSHRFLFKLRTVGIFQIEHSAPNDYGENYRFLSGHVLK